MVGNQISKTCLPLLSVHRVIDKPYQPHLDRYPSWMWTQISEKNKSTEEKKLSSGHLSAKIWWAYSKPKKISTKSLKKLYMFSPSHVLSLKGSRNSRGKAFCNKQHAKILLQKFDIHSIVRYPIETSKDFLAILCCSDHDILSWMKSLTCPFILLVL